MGKILGKNFIPPFQSCRLVEVTAMLTDRKIQSLKIEDGKRHADRDGQVARKYFYFAFSGTRSRKQFHLAKINFFFGSYGLVLTSKINPSSSIFFNRAEAVFSVLFQNCAASFVVIASCSFK